VGIVGEIGGREHHTARHARGLKRRHGLRGGRWRAASSGRAIKARWTSRLRERSVGLAARVVPAVDIERAHAEEVGVGGGRARA
jgi:hypothetical protein